VLVDVGAVVVGVVDVVLDVTVTLSSVILLDVNSARGSSLNLDAFFCSRFRIIMIGRAGRVGTEEEEEDVRAEEDDVPTPFPLRTRTSFLFRVSFCSCDFDRLQKYGYVSISIRNGPYNNGPHSND
jgi:hypothetical protein